MDLSSNHKVIKSVAKGIVVIINEELIVELLGLPNNFGATQILGFASQNGGYMFLKSLGQTH